MNSFLVKYLNQIYFSIFVSQKKKNLSNFILKKKGFIIFIYILETYLDYRQYKQYAKGNLPTEIKDVIEKDKFIKSTEYGRAKLYKQIKKKKKN